jgi:NadR type nicotinamide-nucleotide adenylyltransferase
MARGASGERMMLRVVLSGVESVGKSTLAGELAAKFGGLLVPEFGRTYTERLRRELTLEDHYAIAEGHEIAADQAASAKPRLLVEDTDIVMTTAWATMLFGSRDPILAGRASRGQLHLLLLPDVPFVKDPVRMFGEDAARRRFHEVVEAEFAARQLHPVVIGGDWAGRRAAAVRAIEALV